MWAILKFCLSLATLCIFTTTVTADPLPPIPPSVPGNTGTPLVMPDWKKCLAPGADTMRLEVLPGGGWDNLRNVDMGMVLKHDFTHCKTTDDGQYLIPDDVFIIPLKTSHVQTYAELFDDWSSYSSVTAATINTEARGTFQYGTISGSFSQDYKFVKSHQVQDKAVTTRVQVRYVFYKVKAQPDSQLSTAFKNRLMEIAAHLQSNNDQHAEYLTQILIRDFGTHVVTALDAGAVMAREDSVRSSFRKDQKGSDIKLKLVASYSYMEKYSASQSIGTSFSKDFVKQYLGNRTSSRTYAHGGPPFKANSSMHYWEDNLSANLVAVDRAGDPLHYVITRAVLPELPEPTLRQLASVVENGIKQYYDRNRYPGCADKTSENFNFQANEDDGSCFMQQSNYSFGGVYQTCVKAGSPGRDPCRDVVQKNSKTADFKCPRNYRAIRVLRGKTPSSCRRVCTYWFIFPRCEYKCGHGVYETYWCVAEKAADAQRGFLFGGMYSHAAVNPFTKGKRCPPKYYNVRFGLTMQVCISDNYELGSRNAVPIAGFFSCKTGNPLALLSTEASSVQFSDESSETNMENFLFNSGPDAWPKSCPQGYSQHLGTIEADCAVHYCIKANLLTVNELPNVQRPPFMEFPQPSPNITIPLAIMNDDTDRVYLQNPEEGQWEKKDKSEVRNLNTKAYRYTGSKYEDEGFSTAAAAGLTFGLTAFIGIFIACTIIGCRWRRKKKRQRGLRREMDKYRSAGDDDEVMYGSSEPIYDNTVPLLRQENPTDTGP